MAKTALPIKVLMVMHNSTITGPNMATLSLLKAIDRSICRIDVASPAEGYFAEQLKGMGVTHIPLEFGRYEDIVTILRLIFILRRGGYDILHGHMGRVGPIICIAGKAARVKAIILTEHMSAGSHTWIGNDPFKLFVHRLFHVISNNFLDMVIAVSDKARKSYISRQGIRPEKTAVIYNSIYLDKEKAVDRAAIRARLGLSRDDVVIGTVGRLVREKGYGDVILAAGEILRYNRGVHFLIVGDGPEKENLEKLARAKNLDKKVTFTGFYTDIDDIMEAIDILVHPSWTESAESFGLVLIEAMARRKAVVTSDIEPFFEIIKDGRSGFLFPEKNYRALAEKINLLLGDRKLMEEMGRFGYEIVKEKFDARIIARKTEELYKKILAKKKRG